MQSIIDALSGASCVVTSTAVRTGTVFETCCLLDHWVIALVASCSCLGAQGKGRQLRCQVGVLRRVLLFAAALVFAVVVVNLPCGVRSVVFCCAFVGDIRSLSRR